MQRFCAWWHEGKYLATGTRFDIGMTTRKALARFEATGDPFAGSADPLKAGNGGIMRLAPAVIASAGDAEGFAVVQLLTTHTAPEAVVTARLLARILHRLIDRDDGAKEPATIDYLLVPEFRGAPAIEAIARGDWRTKTRSEICSSGYVVDTLEAALWAVGQTQSFEDALILAVNLAADADTVGAVTGQIAGALYRAVDIPDRWLQPIARYDELLALPGRLIWMNFVSADGSTNGASGEAVCGPAELRGLARNVRFNTVPGGDRHGE